MSDALVTIEASEGQRKCCADDGARRLNEPSRGGFLRHLQGVADRRSNARAVVFPTITMIGRL
jgi:hypothetical protein